MDRLMTRRRLLQIGTGVVLASVLPPDPEPVPQQEAEQEKNRAIVLADMLDQFDPEEARVMLRDGLAEAWTDVLHDDELSEEWSMCYQSIRWMLCRRIQGWPALPPDVRAELAA